MTTGGYAGLDPCVHCGFCLPACPTYEVTFDEADSPRGRIVLMRALARGEMAADDPGLALHLDRCLGCRGCEAVCPSGVLYGPALETARAAIAQARPLPGLVRAALWVLARPSRQRLLWMASRLLRWTRLPALLANGAGTGAPRAAGMLAMLAASRGLPQRNGTRHLASPARRTAATAMPARPAAGGRSEAPRSGGGPDRAALFRGCVMDGLFGHVHGATVRTLAVNGVATAEVPGQVCCGALAAHAGDHDLTRALARETIHAFDAAAPDTPIVVNSAGCGAMLKAYGTLFADDPLAERARAFAARVRDVTEILAERGPLPGRPLALRVAYDAPCHLLHAQHISDAPLQVLAAIPGLVLVPLEGSERCCGSAGLYALVEPELSQEVLARKLDAVRAAEADVVATGNPGCLLHIGAGALLTGLPVALVHPVELLDMSYRA
jgi:glycolate oxidase iron-sulfur subunit